MLTRIINGSRKNKGLGKIYQSNGLKKPAGVGILISNKTDFKLKSVKRDKEGHFILVTEKNPLRGNLNTEHLCPKHKSTLICKNKYF